LVIIDQEAYLLASSASGYRFMRFHHGFMMSKKTEDHGLKHTKALPSYQTVASGTLSTYRASYFKHHSLAQELRSWLIGLNHKPKKAEVSI